VIQVRWWLLLCVVAAPLRAQAADELRIRDSLDAAPWRAFQQAMTAQDPAVVREFIRLPLRVNGPGRGRVHWVRSDAQFAGEFAQLFPPATRALIARLPFDSLWTTWRGTATPRGELWFDITCPTIATQYCEGRSWRLIGINRLR
jgi:hypothetical protein